MHKKFPFEKVFLSDNFIYYIIYFFRKKKCFPFPSVKALIRFIFIIDFGIYFIFIACYAAALSLYIFALFIHNNKIG